MMQLVYTCVYVFVHENQLCDVAHTMQQSKKDRHSKRHLQKKTIGLGIWTSLEGQSYLEKYFCTHVDSSGANGMQTPQSILEGRDNGRILPIATNIDWAVGLLLPIDLVAILAMKKGIPFWNTKVLIEDVALLTQVLEHSLQICDLLTTKRKAVAMNRSELSPDCIQHTIPSFQDTHHLKHRSGPSLPASFLNPDAPEFVPNF
ncbi:hypothetical protein RFI_36100 [Reticulomyxa filosa]|uniref:Uncharacterized protein n=1 Tax=Reticulomyxa filosa TaxID=46433 RepID=X6LKV0_RETFI|nr:hypothetical protein RFI_36100 [Reticulomyxa filosa]|eukprot:ETO01340.1 hypothetical protein RFI_36100 [Reticulomyxa filosa]